MITITDFANAEPPSARISVGDDLFVKESLISPIDEYKKRIADLISYGTETRLNTNDVLGRLLILGVVSNAECYFRSILAMAMEVCPVAQSEAAEKVINLGGVLWHGQQGFSRSAFDNLSFSGAEELRKSALGFIGFKLEPTLFKSALEEYDKVCQLRHGIVHSDGLLPGKNAVKLNVPRFREPVRITARYKHLQDAAAVVDTLVLLFNRQLFALMCKRWAIDWRQRSDWEPERAELLFANIWNAFVSRTELGTRRGRGRMRRIDCMNAVKTEYSI